MTIINIERVNNGWIVRPYEPHGYCCPVAKDVFVYTSIPDLQAALPDLLRTAYPASDLTTTQAVVSLNYDETTKAQK